MTSIKEITNMNEETMSDSENDDVDYVPEQVEENDSSEDYGSNASDDKDDDELSETKIKRKKKRKFFSHDTENSTDNKELKLDVEAMWEEFKKDAYILSNCRSIMSGINEGQNKQIHGNKTDLSDTSVIANNKEIHSNQTENDDKYSPNVCNDTTSSGPLLSSNKPPQGPPKVPGLKAVINHLEKKNKFSVLDRSKTDWNSFKSKEGISSSLEAYNKGKRGYLERQDFLSRTDNRRFEIEKNARNKRRSKQTL